MGALTYQLESIANDIVVMVAAKSRCGGRCTSTDGSWDDGRELSSNDDDWGGIDDIIIGALVGAIMIFFVARRSTYVKFESSRAPIITGYQT